VRRLSVAVVHHSQGGFRAASGRRVVEHIRAGTLVRVGAFYAASMWHLAQVNVAVLRAPLEDPLMAGFAAAFDPVNRLAQESAGFVWRLPTGSGHAVLTAEDGATHLVNLTLWRAYRDLHQFVYRSAHGQLLLRRSRWFLPTRQPSTALWWVPAGTRPGIEQALARLHHLRTHGPSPRAFSLRRQFTPNGQLIQHRQSSTARGVTQTENENDREE
jgi:ribosomal protein L34